MKGHWTHRWQETAALPSHRGQEKREWSLNYNRPVWQVQKDRNEDDKIINEGKHSKWFKRMRKKWTLQCPMATHTPTWNIGHAVLSNQAGHQHFFGKHYLKQYETVISVDHEWSNTSNFKWFNLILCQKLEQHRMHARQSTTFIGWVNEWMNFQIFEVRMNESFLVWFARGSFV